MTRPPIPFDLSVNLDYKTRQMAINLVNPYLTGSSTDTEGRLFRMYDERGTIIQAILMADDPSSTHSQNLCGTGEFGLRFGLTDDFGGYDSSINRSDASGVSVSYANTMWEMSSEFDLLGTVSALENGLRDSFYQTLDRRDSMYLDTPMLITNGDAVIQGTVGSVTGDVHMSLTYDKSISAFTGSNVGDAICEVISGSSSGQTFSVRAHQVGTTTLQMDRDVNHLSGQVVKVMPYRTVDSYSGWVYTGSTNDKLGDLGIRSRFGLTSDIPVGPGSVHYATGTYSGDASVAHPLDILESPVFTASVVALKTDAYMRTITPGDVVYFTPSSSPSAEATGVVLYTTTGHGVEAEGDFTITYWPARAATAGSEYKIARKNTLDLYTYPELSKEYLCVVRDSVHTNTGEKYVTRVQTPSVEVDFAANEYESLFPAISESSHFHIGPVYLSNGQTLMDDDVGSNRVTPHLFFSGAVTNGDPESPTTIIDSEAFSSQNPDAAHKYNGMYFKDGVMTMSTNTSFSASETLICKAIINYGSIKIDRVFTIPVQPSV